MSNLKRKCIAFDIDTKELKKHYKGSDWHNAYDDIGRFLDKRGFERSQGSVYDSKKAMKNSAIGEIIDDICDKFKWFAPCVKSIRGYDQPKVVDYTKQATERAEKTLFSDIDVSSKQSQSKALQDEVKKIAKAKKPQNQDIDIDNGGIDLDS